MRQKNSLCPRVERLLSSFRPCGLEPKPQEPAAAARIDVFHGASAPVPNLGICGVPLCFCCATGLAKTLPYGQTHGCPHRSIANEQCLGIIED
jgi:hypothetical protein